MNYKTLGKSGVRVAELSLGAMTFGTSVKWGADKNTSKQMFEMYANAGGNFIDTANIYTSGESEKFVGEFVGNDRDFFVIATKFVFTNNPKNPNASGSHKKNMVQALEASLKRLNMDYVDLLWIHRHDPYTPVDEVMQGLHHLVQQGKVLYTGVSNVPAWWIAKANTTAEFRGWTPFSALQIEYSLIERTVERDLIPMAKDYGMAVTAWGPLASGILTGKYRQTGSEEQKRLDTAPFKDVSERNLSIADEVVKIADETGHSPAQVAINWVRQQDERIIPILGARTVNQLQDNLNCLDFELSEQHINRLNEISAIDPGFPHDFIIRTNRGLTGEMPIQNL